MTWIEDGSNIDYSSDKPIKGRYSWGWLGDEVPQDKLGWADAQLKQKVINRLSDIVGHKEDYCVHVHMGHHNCEICCKNNDTDLGWNGSILIRHNSKEFRAPWAVSHYVNRHNYNPGNEVIDALLHGKLVTYDEIDGEEWRQSRKRREEVAKRKAEERQRLEDAKSPEQKEQDAKRKEWEIWAANKVQSLRDSGAIVDD